MGDLLMWIERISVLMSMPECSIENSFHENAKENHYSVVCLPVINTLLLFLSNFCDFENINGQTYFAT